MIPLLDSDHTVWEQSEVMSPNLLVINFFHSRLFNQFTLILINFVNDGPVLLGVSVS